MCIVTDPDLKVAERYRQLVAKGTVKKHKVRPEPESDSEHEVSLHLWFTLQIPFDLSPIAQRPRKSARTRQWLRAVCTKTSFGDPTDMVPAAGQIWPLRLLQQGPGSLPSLFCSIL